MLGQAINGNDRDQEASTPQSPKCFTSRFLFIIGVGGRASHPPARHSTSSLILSAIPTPNDPNNCKLAIGSI